jgi:predicted nucleic acid-binding Zn ribbon protein
MQIKWFVGLVLKGTGDWRQDLRNARDRLTHSERPDAITKIESEGSK